MGERKWSCQAAQSETGWLRVRVATAADIWREGRWDGGMLSDKPSLPVGITQYCTLNSSAGGAGCPGHTGVLGTVTLLYPGCL